VLYDSAALVEVGQQQIVEEAAMPKINVRLIHRKKLNLDRSPFGEMVMDFSIIELSPNKIRISRDAKKKAEPNTLTLP